MPYYEIKRNISPLERHKWEFRLDGTYLILERYSIGKKESEKKRTYQTIKQYDRLSRGNSTIVESDVPLPDDVVKEVIENVSFELRVIKFNDRYK